LCEIWRSLLATAFRSRFRPLTLQV
jgi:hypothetical protein